jgi:glycerophosphoryl diester phosphodiesterase
MRSAARRVTKTRSAGTRSNSSSEEQPLPSARTERAIVIAHRGASGYLPEHTLVGKALAYGLGADFLEQDVVATRDSELVVLHDLHLDDVSDVAQRFPDRRRSDGLHYAIDFELAELRQLTLFERRTAGGSAAKYPTRFPGGIGIARIATLHEELRLIQGLNHSMGRTVGVYAEIKHPQWHRQHGIDLSRLVLAKLQAFGYSQPQHAAFVQCFDAEELRRVRHELGCELRLIQLVGDEPAYIELLTPAGLATVARYAYGLGPGYRQLVSDEGGRPRITSLTVDAREAGLRLHPYTFRREELPSYAATLEQLLEVFLGQVRVDGVFCDFPDVAVRVRAELSAQMNLGPGDRNQAR